jgi:predicted DNA-binding protein with PD1-like motif
MKNYTIILFLNILTSCLFISCSSSQKNSALHPDTSYAIRLLPGTDLKSGIENYIKENHIKAGWLVTCVGSLTEYNIRFANKSAGTVGAGHFEILSLTGTLSENGSHIHISIADSTGHTIGGHLLEGCKIYTTAEIVMVKSSRYIFTREDDGSSGWKELQIKKL